MTNSFNARTSLNVGGRDYQYFSLKALAGQFNLARLPYSYKILLENLLRHEDGANTTKADIEALAGADLKALPAKDINFTPARVTSPACPAWSTSPPCATPSRSWAATRPR